MTALTDVEAAAGLLLFFFLPGYAVTKALFPEWRIHGAQAGRRAVEIVTLSFVTSVALTVFVGYLLLVATPSGGFQAYWSSPVLEAVLLALTLVAALVAGRRGAFASIPPPAPAPAADTGEDGAWELMGELDRLSREERRLTHSLRTHAQNASERSRLTEELEEVRAQRERLRARREAEYAR